jgi:hypothetical protein
MADAPTRFHESNLWSTPIRDLGLTIEGTRLEPILGEFREELRRCGLTRVRPQFYLSTEWGVPFETIAIALPFYLARPDLTALHAERVGIVEGFDRADILRYLRHEMGHVINYAYRLYDEEEWVKQFGSITQPYGEDYRPEPFSRRYVRHLPGWYAQKHPDEDFAETFAVWLTPDSDWRRRYSGWPALRKLEYVDKVMGQIASRPPLETKHQKQDNLSSLRKTLRSHYAQRRGHYGIDHPPSYDQDLLRLFSRAPENARQPPAWRWLSKVRGRVRVRVSRWTRQRQYVVDGVLKGMIARCHELRLRLAGLEDEVEREFSVLLAVEVMNQLHSGGHRVPL